MPGIPALKPREIIAILNALGFVEVGQRLESPLTLVRILIGIGVVSTFYMLYFLKTERSWDFTFGLLYSYFAVFALTWIPTRS